MNSKKMKISCFPLENFICFLPEAINIYAARQE